MIGKRNRTRLQPGAGLRRLDDSSGSMLGMALIADFGEVGRKQSSGQVPWTLGVMKLDLP